MPPPPFTVSIATTDPTFSCPFCCIEKSNSALARLSQCSHESCRECLVTWIEKTEATGQSTLPACPWCRSEIPSDETHAILGRPFSPQTATASRPEEYELDDLTRQWLQEQTQTCPGCGACIEKIPGGCDLMECICGFRFCYNCGSQGANCNCTPSDHYFWDNILDRQSRRNAPPLATRDEATGHINLQKHLRQRMREEHCKQSRLQRQCLREEEEEEIEELMDGYSNWLYATASRQGTFRVLQQMLAGEELRYARALSVEDDEDVELTGVGAAPRLLHKEDGGFKYLVHYFSRLAVRTRARRLRSKEHRSKDLTGVDAAYSSGKWLYDSMDNAGTYRHIKYFSKHLKNETAVDFERWFLKGECCCNCDFEEDGVLCDLCIQQEQEHAVRNRTFFLDKEARARELQEIQEQGL